jgi:hypothetical protein
MKRNPDVDHDLSHECAKYQFQIPYIFGYTKMISVWISVCIFSNLQILSDVVIFV